MKPNTVCCRLEKIGKMIQQMIVVLFFIIMLYVVFLVVFLENHIKYACRINFFLGNIFLLITGLIFIGLILILSRKLKNLEASLSVHPVRKLLVVTSFLFLIQVYVCYNAYFKTAWDAGLIFDNAKAIMESRYQDLNNAYFSQWPNNILLAYLFSIIMKIDQIIGIFDTSEGLMGLIIVQCLISCTTGYLIFRVVQESANSYRAAWGAWILYLMLIGTSPWLMIPYSDSFGLMLPSLILRLYQLTRNGRYLLIKWMGIVLSAYWGYHIKPQIVLVFLAIVAVEIISYHSDKEKNKVPFLIGLGGLFCLLISGFLYGQIVKQTGLIIDQEREFGISHYLMMGLNKETNGVYLDEDTQYSAQFPTVKERSEGNLAKVAERLKEYGPGGLGIHLLKKTLTNFADGTFAWSIEGTFYYELYECKNKVMSPLLRDILWEGGHLHIYFNTFKQVVWLTILVLSLGIVINRKAVDKVCLAMVTALIGLAMFQLLFEARARYLYTYTPFYIITAVLGLKNWINWLARLSLMKNIKEIDRKSF